MKTFRKKAIGLTIFAVLIPVVLYAIDATYDTLTATYGKFGVSNTFSGSPSAAIGWNNSTAAGGTMVIGENLYTADKNCLVVGENNKNDFVANSEFFVVGNGNGASASQRRNALEVKRTGDVNIPLTSSTKLTVGYSGVGTSVTTKIYGTADIDRVPPKGGIGMGSYDQ